MLSEQWSQLCTGIGAVMQSFSLSTVQISICKLQYDFD